MGNFAYVARSSTGDELTGFLSAANVDEAVTELHGRGYIVLHVAEESRKREVSAMREAFVRFRQGRVGTRHLALFTRQLATVLQAGIPVVRGLRGLAADTQSRVLARAVNDVADRIEGGESISDAMAAHPEAFNRLYISMMRAGERAGTLDDILDEVAIYLEKMDAIRTKVKAAMSYPIFVLAFAVLATLFLLFKVVPTFVDIYAEFGQKLPALTLLVVNISQMVRQNAPLTFLGLAAILLCLYVFTRTPTGRYLWHSFQLRMPIFGPIIRKAVMSRFARTFGILTRSGLPLMDSLQLVRGTTGNAVVGRAVIKAGDMIGAGNGITASFRATRTFPEMVLQLMATGEEAGNLDEMLIKASDFYDRQVEAAVQSLTSLIEPVMIVMVGGIIGVIVISMFLPIFYLGEAIMKGGYNY